jgi:predicted nuclease of predicted toxin-antitoxin system
VDFLVDASMPRGTATLIHSRAHNATDVRDIGMGGAPDQDIAAYAQAHQMAILSRDFDFADVRNYPPNQYMGLVVIDLPSTATAPTILKLVENFIQDSQALSNLPGRLAIIQPGRNRFRPPP